MEVWWATGTSGGSAARGGEGKGVVGLQRGNNGVMGGAHRDDESAAALLRASSVFRSPVSDERQGWGNRVLAACVDGRKKGDKKERQRWGGTPLLYRHDRGGGRAARSGHVVARGGGGLGGATRGWRPASTAPRAVGRTRREARAHCQLVAGEDRVTDRWALQLWCRSAQSNEV
jgi:hypothetical protein